MSVRGAWHGRQGRRDQLVDPLQNSKRASSMPAADISSSRSIRRSIRSATRYLAAELKASGYMPSLQDRLRLGRRPASPTLTNMAKAQAKAPAHRLVSIEDVESPWPSWLWTAPSLLQGETFYIDGGYHVID